MKVGNWPAGITKYMTAAMMQIIARMYAMALIEPSPPVEQSVFDVGENHPAQLCRSMLVLGWRAGRGRGAARLVGVGHAFLHEGAPRLALQVLVIGAELASRHLVLRCGRVRRRPG